MFDSFTSAGNFTTTTASPRIFIGTPFNFDAGGDNDPSTSKIVVYTACSGTAGQT